MVNIVLLGGNGYIGKNMTKYWEQKDPTAHFYIVSRSGKNPLAGNNIHNIRADVTDFEETDALLPEKITYIADLIGKPEKNRQKFELNNVLPAQTMLKIAQKHHVKAMGFVGASLGDKSFIKGKKKIIADLEASGIPLAVVSPTLVYGEERESKIAPFLDFISIFSKKYKPVTVTEVASTLVNKIVKAGSKRASLL